MMAVLRHVEDLGPLAPGLGVLPLQLPGTGREPLDLSAELRRAIGADGVLDPLRLTSEEHGRLVQGAVAPDVNLSHARGERGHGPGEEPGLPAASGDMPIAELVGDPELTFE
jgi:hypothetical protein